eukprot:774927-Rhodomonas_salina.1
MFGTEGSCYLLMLVAAGAGIWAALATFPHPMRYLLRVGARSSARWRWLRPRVQTLLCLGERPDSVIICVSTGHGMANA